jgi:N-acetylneuraminic acid mutarotase
LTLEERLQAHEAIQRVTYSHQIGATLAFEEAYPRELLEAQVRDTLKLSDALDRYWHAPVTSAALRAEMERIARQTRLPERLQEIYSALGGNSLLIEECFARASLVSRLTRSFFARDQRIHGAQRAKAEALRDRIVRGHLSVDAPMAQRSVAVRVTDDSMTAEDLRQWRSMLPEKIGEAGPLQESEDAFFFQVVLSDEPMKVGVATYSLPKTSWQAWWRESRSGFHEEAVATVASDSWIVVGNGLPNSRPSSSTLPRRDSLEQRPAGHGLSTVRDPGLETLSSSSCLQASWDNGILDDQPQARSGHTAVWTGTHMVIWGGSQVTGFKYDPLIDNWEQISSTNAPSGRSLHTAVWTGSKMIVWGGNGYLNTGGIYDPSTDAWTPTSTAGAPLGRVEHTSIWTGSRMVVFGGETSMGSLTSTGGRFDPVMNTWSSMADSPESRYVHTAVWTGSEMLVWGGYTAVTGLIATPRKYDPATDVWSTFSAVNQPEVRAAHGAVWTGSQMIVWGGQGGGFNLTSGGRYDPLSDTWTPTSLSNAPISLRPARAWTGTEVITWSSATGRRYDPVADVWTTLPALNAPTAFTGMAAVWTGDEMIIWGGSSSSVPLDTGARYDPEFDAWTPMSLLIPPRSRDSHSAVWTGNEMIVWGGNLVTSTGGRYDPLIDSWSPTSILGAPSVRSEHSAVWTGSRMIVWGGTSNGFDGVLNTGGRYDPITDTWTPTALLLAPAARKRASAVWTGNKMIVWGGIIPGAPTYLNSGGLYDPALDTWTFTSNVNVPEGRWAHTAVWTGTRMIVWGGVGAGLLHYFSTGGQYDPGSDQWTPTSTAGGPASRAHHASVWTGSRMIIWGGQAGNGRLGLHTGAQYDPAANQWTPMATLGVPAARREPAAVWTGTHMIVWGGVTGVNSPVNSGGIYDPALNQWIAATPFSGAPDGRRLHSAVWTGSRMIVWGGTRNGGVRFANGGRLRLDLLPDTDADGDGVGACSGDCDDFSAAVHPGGTELCNGLDDNCAGGPDEPFDQDLDGFATCGGDCNDSSGAINPGANDICNPVDENCNDHLDDGLCGSDSCSAGTCNSSGACSQVAPIGTPCNDANACTQTDACNASGSCIGSNPKVCTPADACQGTGTCVPPTGFCTYPSPVPDGTTCDDANACTLGETCTSGICGSGSPRDADSDGHADPACGGNDCNESNAQVWASPGEVANLTVTTVSPASLSWSSLQVQAGWETVYDLASGSIKDPGQLDIHPSDCLASATASTSYSDSRPAPSLGQAHWYLARAKNSCGVGNYGAGSNAVVRTIPACP